MLTLSPHAVAQSTAAPADLPSVGRTTIGGMPHPTDRVWVNQPGDGLMWARGSDWKASFGSAGISFVPFLGSSAPRDFPLGLQLIAARSGGAVLPLDLGSAAERAGPQRVVIARGVVTEVYELDPQHVEQEFVFASAADRGQLSVDLAMHSELQFHDEVDGSFTFGNELGGVRYGAATAVDARGARSVVASMVHDGVLTLTVPADFVARATFPVTIDPVFSTFTWNPGGPPQMQYLNPDVAFAAAAGGIYAMVQEEAYSATDHDVYLQGMSPAGALVPGDYVDYTTDSWTVPKVASNRGAGEFLCVAQRNVVLPSTWGCLVTYNPFGPQFAFGSQFPIQGTSLLNVGSNPDVGGDPNPYTGSPGNYCVTWENNNNIYYNLVRTDGSLLTPYGLNIPVIASHPSISKSCGVGAANTRQWIIVWQYTYSATDEDIYASVVDLNGNLVVTQSYVDTSSYSDSSPQVSSLTDLTDGTEKWMAVYQRYIPGGPFSSAHTDLYGSVFTGTTAVTGTVNLTALLNRPSNRDQIHPCVDTDGTRFAIGFSEAPSIFTSDIVPYLATVHVLGSSLGVTSYPEVLNAYAGPDDHLQITSQRSGGAFTTSYMAVWDVASTTNSSMSVLGAFYGGYTNLPSGSYFNHAVAGCGTLTLTATGLPALGDTFFLNLTGAQGLPFLMLGAPAAPIPLCAGCNLGLDPTSLLLIYTTSYALTVPQETSLIALQVAAQGLDFLAPGGCSSPLTATVSDAIFVTIL